MDEQKTIASGFIWNTLFFFLTKLSAFIYTILIARLFSQEDIGSFYYVFSITGILFLFADFGISSAFGRYVPFLFGKGEKESLKKLFRWCYFVGTAWSLLFSIAVFLLSGEIATALGYSELKPLFQFMSAWIVIKEVDELNRAFLRGRKKLKHWALIDFTQNFLKLILTIGLFGLLGNSANLLAVAFLLSFILAMVLGIILALREYYELNVQSEQQTNDYHNSKVDNDKPLDNWLKINRIRENLNFFSSIVVFGMSITFVQFLSIIQQYFDRIMIGYLLPNGLTDVAIYTVAISLASLTSLLPMAIFLGYYPVIGELFGANQKEKIRKVISVTLKWCTIVTLPIVIILIVFGKEIIIMFYGNSFASGYGSLVFLAIAMLMNIIALAATYLFIVMRRVDIEIKLGFIVTMANVFFNLLFIPMFGIIGAALGTLMSCFIMALLAWNYAKSILEIQFPNKIFTLVGFGLICFALIIALKELLQINIIALNVDLPLIQKLSLENQIAQKVLKLSLIMFITAIIYAMFGIMLIVGRQLESEEFEIIKTYGKKIGINEEHIDCVLRFLQKQRYK